MHLYCKMWLWLIGFALVYCVGVNERENQISGMEMFQSNIYDYASIKRYILHAHDSCACTRFLCMPNTLVHAQHSCACTGEARDQGRDPKQSSRGLGPGQLFFCWVPALVPGPSSACTRVLCMRKSVVHAQESCACTRILGLKTHPCC